LRKIAITIVLVMFAFTFLLLGCSNSNKPIVIGSFGNEKAISLIAKHYNISEDAIKINEIKEIERNHWFVLYQQKPAKAVNWEPSDDSNFGMDIKKSAGDYLTSNDSYGMPAVFASLEEAY
jgi:hypothetical protein